MNCLQCGKHLDDRRFCDEHCEAAYRRNRGQEPVQSIVRRVMAKAEGRRYPRVQPKED